MTTYIATTTQNSEFLLGLLLEENKHMNPIDFIDRQNKASAYSCMCVSLGVAQEFESLRDIFLNINTFTEKYFNIYVSALDNYHSIVGNDTRQVYFDEASVFYPLNLTTFSTNNLVTNTINKETAIELLSKIKNEHSYAIILRDEIAFCVIHYENDNFIVLDPHVECCGILSKTGVYRYVVYDNIWNFDVHVMTPNIADKQESASSTAEAATPNVLETGQMPKLESAQTLESIPTLESNLNSDSNQNNVIPTIQFTVYGNNY